MVAPPVLATVVASPAGFPASSAGSYLATNSAEGTVTGTAVTTVNSATGGSAFTAVNIGSGATFAFDTTRAAHGASAYKVGTVASANSYVTWTAPASMPPQSWFRMYLYVTGYPAAAFRLLTFLNGASRCGYVQLGAAGQLQFIDHATTIMCQTVAAVPLSAWFRAEGYLLGDPAAGQAELQLFPVADGILPSEIGTSAAGQNTTGTPTAFSLGPFTAASVGPYWYDDLGVSTSGYMGPTQPVMNPATVAAPAGFPAVYLTGVISAAALAASTTVPVPAIGPMPAPATVTAGAGFPAVTITGVISATTLAASTAVPVCTVSVNATATPATLAVATAFPGPVASGNSVTVATTTLAASTAAPLPTVTAELDQNITCAALAAGTTVPVPAITTNLATPTNLAVAAAFPAASAGGILDTNTASGGTSGVTVTTANSGGTSGTAFNAVTIGTGATLAFDSSHAAHIPAMSYKLATPGTAAAVYAQWTAPGAMPPQVWFRLYLYYTTFPMSNYRLLSFLQGGTYCGYLQAQSTGHLAWVAPAGATMVNTSPTTIPLNQWFRAEGYLLGDPAAGQAELRLFTVADGILPSGIWTSAATFATTGFANTFNIGDAATRAFTGPYWMDDLGVSSAAYMGPSQPVMNPATVAAAAGFPPPAVAGTSVNVTAATLTAAAAFPPPAVAGTSVNVTAALYATGTAFPAPALSTTSVTITVAVTAAATITVPAATASSPAAVAAATVTATAAVPVPVVEQDTTVTAATVTAAATLTAPAAAGSAGALAATVTAGGAFPAVTVTAITTVTPATVTASTTVPVPVVTGSLIGVCAVAAAGFPGIIITGVVTGSPAVSAAAFLVPVVTGGHGTAITTAHLATGTAAVPVPVVEQDTTVTPAGPVASAAFPAPGVSGSVTVSPAAASAVIPAAAVTPSPAPATSAAAFPAPGVSGSVTVSPAAASVTIMTGWVVAGRVGVYLSGSTGSGGGGAGFAAGNTLWQSWTGTSVPAARYYLALSTFGIQGDMTAMIAAGTKICLTIRPAYNPVSSTDLASLTTLLQNLTAAGAVVDVALWHEPFYQGLSSAQFISMVEYYGPTVRQYYPLVFVPNVASLATHNEGAYYPGDAWIDKICVDCYDSQYKDGQNLTAAEAIADGAWPPKPFGIWEFNGCTDPATGQSQTDVTTFFSYIQTFMTARLAAGKINADILLFSSGEGNWLGNCSTQNAGFTGGIGDWAQYTSGNCAVAYTTAQAHSAPAGALQVTAAAAGTMEAYCALGGTGGQNVTAGTTSVGVQAWFRAATSTRTCSVAVLWYTSAGVYVSTSTSTAVSDSTSAWTQVSYTVTAPATAAYALPLVIVNSAGSGEVHYVDDVNLYVSATSPSQCNVIDFPWDYRLGLWETLYTALNAAPTYGSSAYAFPATLTVTPVVASGLAAAVTAATLTVATARPPASVSPAPAVVALTATQPAVAVSGSAAATAATLAVSAAVSAASVSPVAVTLTAATTKPAVAVSGSAAVSAATLTVTSTVVVAMTAAPATLAAATAFPPAIWTATAATLPVTAAFLAAAASAAAATALPSYAVTVSIPAPGVAVDQITYVMSFY